MDLFQSDVAGDECLCMSGGVSPLLTAAHCSQVVQGSPYWAGKEAPAVGSSAPIQWSRTTNAPHTLRP